MDNTTGTGSGGTGSGSPDPREDLREQLQVMGRAAGDLLEQLVKVPATLAQIPLQALPEDTATHARNAASEGFAAVRSLLDSMSRGIDQMMREQRERMANAGSTQTGVGGPSSSTGTSTTSTSDTGTGMGTRALDAGSMSDGGSADNPTTYLGGHGSGSGASGSGSSQE